MISLHEVKQKVEELIAHMENDAPLYQVLPKTRQLLELIKADLGNTHKPTPVVETTPVAVEAPASIADELLVSLVPTETPVEETPAPKAKKNASTAKPE